MNMELFDDYFKRDYCNYIEKISLFENEGVSSFKARNN